MAEAILSIPNTSESVKDYSERLDQESSKSLPASSSAEQTTTVALASEAASEEDPAGVPTEGREQIASSTDERHSFRHPSPQAHQDRSDAKTESPREYQPTDQSLPAKQEEEQSERLCSEAQASSLQPPTPPLSSPAGASPTSRPASVTEGEETSRAGPSDYPPLHEVAEGIREAIRSSLRCVKCCKHVFLCPQALPSGPSRFLKCGSMENVLCRVSEVRRHPPEAMEDSLPSLRVVAAEIETPGQSPRGDALSPSTSGDSFGKALMHQAMRLKTAMLNQKVLLCHSEQFCAIFEVDLAICTM